MPGAAAFPLSYHTGVNIDFVFCIQHVNCAKVVRMQYLHITGSWSQAVCDFGYVDIFTVPVSASKGREWCSVFLVIRVI
jgi:hypothetical protein